MRHSFSLEWVNVEYEQMSFPASYTIFALCFTIFMFVGPQLQHDFGRLEPRVSRLLGLDPINTAR